MRIRVLGAYGGSTPDHRQTSFLVGDGISLDAGALTEALSLDEQSRIRTVLVTHSHMDHVAALPFLVENAFGLATEPIEVIATPAVVGSLRTHLFNNDLWPDFTRIPNRLLPTVGFREAEPFVPFRVGPLTATPVPVDHVVPTCGYVLSDERSAVVFSSDTGPTEAIWKIARETPNLKAVFLECSFPNEMAEVARVSCHLTPALVQAELRKVPPDVPVFLYHMKPTALATIVAQVAALREPRLRLLSDGEILEF